MQHQIRISVVIPTCDRQDYLLETLDSIKNQTDPPFEIVVVNNGRDKLQGDIIKKYNCKIIDIIPYAGVVQARNYGACNTSGNFLAFIDDDDIWGASYLELVRKAITEGARCIISRLDQLLDSKVLPYKNADGKIDFKNLFIHNPGVTGSNLVIEKALFYEIGGYDPRLPTSEDKSLVIEIIKKGFAVDVLPDNQAIMRQHDSSVRLSGAASMAEGIFQFTRKYYKEMTVFERFINYSKIIHYKGMYGSTILRKFYVIMYYFIKPCNYLLRRFVN